MGRKGNTQGPFCRFSNIGPVLLPHLCCSSRDDYRDAGVDRQSALRHDRMPATAVALLAFLAYRHAVHVDFGTRETFLASLRETIQRCRNSTPATIAGAAPNMWPRSCCTTAAAPSPPPDHLAVTAVTAKASPRGAHWPPDQFPLETCNASPPIAFIRRSLTLSCT